MKGVILAGGSGSRIKPFTNIYSKHLIPIYDEPLIYKPIRTLVNSGISDIQIVLSYESGYDIVRLIKSGKCFGKEVNICYSFQDEPKGIAHAIMFSKQFVGNEKFVTILGDNIFEESFIKYVKLFERDNVNKCYLFLSRVKNPERYGIAYFKNNQILDIYEKPSTYIGNLAVTGIYFYDSIIFKYIKEVMEKQGLSQREEYEITDVNNHLIKENLVKHFYLDKFWIDAGEFDGILSASTFFSGQRDLYKEDHYE